MKKEYDILPTISKDQITVGSDQRELYCPICQCLNTHIKSADLDFQDEWHGNGEVSITKLWSECGSEWEVCIGYHKGTASIFARISKSCKN